DGEFHFVTTGDAPPPGEEDLDTAEGLASNLHQIQLALQIFAVVPREAQRAAWLVQHLMHRAVAGHLRANQLGREATVGPRFASCRLAHPSKKVAKKQKLSSSHPRAGR